MLQRVERLVGGKLFERGRSGAIPTALGGQMLQRARLLLVELEAFGSDMAGRGGPIRFGSVHMECVGALYSRLEDALDDDGLTVRMEGLCSSCPAWPATLYGLIRPYVHDTLGIAEVRVEGRRLSSAAALRLQSALGGGSHHQ